MRLVSLMRKLTLLTLLICALTVRPQQRSLSAAQTDRVRSIDELQRLFLNPPDDSRIMMRWWWFGPAVTKPQLERELRLMKEGGIGGFEIQPVYPVALDDGNLKTLPYLSDPFIDALKFTNDKARELGLRVDLTVGSGWPYGGPWTPISLASARLRVERVKIAEKARRLPTPNVSEGEKLIAVFLVNQQ